MHYSPHSFRIGVATALRAAGFPLEQIKQFCRWRSDESTLLYALVDEATFAQHMQALDPAASDQPLDDSAINDIDTELERSADIAARAMANSADDLTLPGRVSSKLQPPQCCLTNRCCACTRCHLLHDRLRMYIRITEPPYSTSPSEK